MFCLGLNSALKIGYTEDMVYSKVNSYCSFINLIYAKWSLNSQPDETCHVKSNLRHV